MIRRTYISTLVLATLAATFALPSNAALLPAATTQTVSKVLERDGLLEMLIGGPNESAQLNSQADLETRKYYESVVGTMSAMGVGLLYVPGKTLIATSQIPSTVKPVGSRLGAGSNLWDEFPEVFDYMGPKFMYEVTGNEDMCSFAPVWFGTKGNYEQYYRSIASGAGSLTACVLAEASPVFEDFWVMMALHGIDQMKLKDLDITNEQARTLIYSYFPLMTQLIKPFSLREREAALKAYAAAYRSLTKSERMRQTTEFYSTRVAAADQRLAGHAPKLSDFKDRVFLALRLKDYKVALSWAELAVLRFPEEPMAKALVVVAKSLRRL